MSISTGHWVGLIEIRGEGLPLVYTISDDKSRAEDRVEELLRVSMNSNTHINKSVSWRNQGHQEYTNSIPIDSSREARGLIRSWQPTTRPATWLKGYARDPCGLLKGTSESWSRKRCAEHAAAVHLSNQYEISDFSWPEGNMRQNWPNMERIYTQILGRISSHTREKVALLGSILTLLVEIALRLLGLSNTVTLGSISGLEEAKTVFVETATTLSYSLTGFALTGLAVVAVAAIVYNQDRNQFNNANRPPPWDSDEEPKVDDDLDYEPDHQQVRIRRLTKAFKQGIFLSISASILGIIYQSINSSLPELSQNTVVFVQLFNGHLIFYLFLAIFIGMVLTAVDITELIVSVVDDRT